MEEFIVQKQGSIKAGSWTQRVLCLHAGLGLATVSGKNRPGDKLQQCMRVCSVQLWPQYDEKHLKEKFQSTEAKLTLRVKGVPAKVGFREVNTANGTSRIYRFTKAGPDAEHLSWMLRFSSVEELEKAVRLFNAMRVNDDIGSSSTSRASVQQTPQSSGAATETRQGSRREATAATSIVAGDVQQELWSLRCQAQSSPKPIKATGYTDLEN